MTWGGGLYCLWTEILHLVLERFIGQEVARCYPNVDALDNEPIGVQAILSTGVLILLDSYPENTFAPSKLRDPAVEVDIQEMAANYLWSSDDDGFV